MTSVSSGDLVQMYDAFAVQQTLYTFAQGIDTRDFELLRTVYPEKFDYDYSSHRAGSIGEITREAWVTHAAARFRTMKATQHTMTNPRVTITGDSAVCRMYVEAWHVADVDGVEDWCTIGGEYIDELTRIDGKWLITKLCLVRRWTIGNPAVLDLPTGE